MITLFTLPGNHSSRYAKRYLEAHDIPFVERKIQKQRLTYDEFKTIIRATENGIDDILAKSKEIKYIEENIKPLSEHTLKEFYSLSLKYPRIIKVPIALTKNMVIIGFDKNVYQRFIPKDIRKKEYYNMLQKLRERENQQMLNEQRQDFRR